MYTYYSHCPDFAFKFFNFMLKNQEMRFPRLPNVESHKPKSDVKRRTTKHIFFWGGGGVKMFPTTNNT